MRRTDREIDSRAEIEEVIRGAQVCRLAFALGNEPYIVPISFGFDGVSLYFHTAPTGKKIDFINANRRVCFELERNVKLERDASGACKWTFSFESVVGYGTVNEVEAVEEKVNGLNQIMLHYSGREWDFEKAQLAQTRVWRVEIESMTGKRSRLKTTP